MIIKNTIDCNFTNCICSGYGGAIAINSTLMTTQRVIKNCIFTECVCIDNKGNDFADINNNNNTLYLYEISNITSNSNIIKFYFESLDLSLDCIFSNECGEIEVFVGDGYNYIFCGSSSSDTPRCKTIDYAWDYRLNNTNGTIYITNGTYGMNIRGGGYYNVCLEGVVNENDFNEDNYPIIYCSSTSSSYWFDISYNSQQIGFKNLKLIYPSNGFTGYFFYSYISTGYINLTNSYIVSNTTNSHRCLFYIYYGHIYIINTTFHTHIVNESILYYSNIGSDIDSYITNCTFKSILSTTYYPTITYCSSPNPNITFTGCTFVNTTSNSLSSYASAICLSLNCTSKIFNNNSFFDISSTNSCLLFNVYTNFTFNELFFNNIISSSSIGGGAITINSTSTSYTLIFKKCNFKKCETKNSYGGISLLNIK
jgi:hypothetical protein